jgi:hypothetical protein
MVSIPSALALMFGEADFDVLRPKWDEAPAHHVQTALACLTHCSGELQSTVRNS